MAKVGFTLVELLAVIVVLALILVISIPIFTVTIESATVNSFKIDAKMIIKSINYKITQDKDYDVTTIDVIKLSEDFDISNENYESISVENSNELPYIYLVGKNKWEGLIACGTFSDITVMVDEVCPKYLYNQGLYSSIWEEGYETAEANSIRTKTDDYLMLSTTLDIGEVLGEETSYVTNDRIDLTNYNTLNIEWERILLGNNLREIESLDISSLSGEFYIRVHNRWDYGAQAMWVGFSELCISTEKIASYDVFDLTFQYFGQYWPQSEELRIHRLWLE